MNRKLENGPRATGDAGTVLPGESGNAARYFCCRIFTDSPVAVSFDASSTRKTE